MSFYENPESGEVQQEGYNLEITRICTMHVKRKPSGPSAASNHFKQKFLLAAMANTCYIHSASECDELMIGLAWNMKPIKKKQLV
jgi:hypothetical protein